jgi:hypothetical protein
MNFETFKSIHQQQLQSIPEQLWQSVFEQTCQKPLDTKGWLTLVPTGAPDQPPVLTAGQEKIKESLLLIPSGASLVKKMLSRSYETRKDSWNNSSPCSAKPHQANHL